MTGSPISPVFGFPTYTQASTLRKVGLGGEWVEVWCRVSSLRVGGLKTVGAVKGLHASLGSAHIKGFTGLSTIHGLSTPPIHPSPPGMAYRGYGWPDRPGTRRQPCGWTQAYLRLG